MSIPEARQRYLPRVCQTSLSILFGRFPGFFVPAPTVLEYSDFRHNLNLESRGDTESQ